MRWTRQLSKILGTGTSTTCFRESLRGDHVNHVVGALLGVLLRTLLLDLLLDFLWDRRLCGCRLGPERFGLWSIPVPDLVGKLRRSFADLRVSTNRLRYHVSV